MTDFGDNPNLINLTYKKLSLMEQVQKELWVIGTISTPLGVRPRIENKLSFIDKIGSYKARWAIGRMKFNIPPGLYALGAPDENSPVMISANYKMSFDRLRSSLDNMNIWILVIDTKGINVWCAAGKGTFGTDEIIGRIKSERLDRVVKHRKIIVPQLGAPGISAHEVKDKSGFRVIYGPVRAEDVKDFLKNGMKASPEMRRVKFGLTDRAVLIPCDLIQSLKYLWPAALALLVLSGIGPDLYSVNRMITNGFANVFMLSSIYILSNTIPPILLPYIPGRAFALKGAVAGILMSLMIVLLSKEIESVIPNIWTICAWIIFAPTISSFICMNFTGSSTYTSLSGVKKEMKFAVPIQSIMALGGLVVWSIGLFI